MKIAVMQPYFLPYYGYFQLIGSSDRFYFLDDVNYINKGWINRNFLCVNGQPNLFTIPISKASQNIKINQLYFLNKNEWLENLYKKIIQSYRKSINFHEVIKIVEDILSYDDLNISNFCINSVRKISDFIGINVEFKKTSLSPNYSYFQGENRIIEICKNNNADEYLNLPGGVKLYSEEIFSKNNIELKFIQPYSPLKTSVEGVNLSILDTLFINDIGAIRNHFSSLRLNY